jgi:hypothetical protein
MARLGEANRRGGRLMRAGAGLLLAAEAATLVGSQTAPRVITASAEAPQKSPIVNGLTPLVREGFGAGLPDSRDMLQRFYPELNPDLVPFLNSAIISDAGVRNGYLQYVSDPGFDATSLFRAADIDRSFRGNTEPIGGKIDGVSFSARLRPETPNDVLIVPSSFVLPGEKASERRPKRSEWTYKEDPEFGKALGVVRIPDPVQTDKISLGISVNRAFDAVAAAKAFEIVGDKKPLKPKQVKEVLESLGDVALARRMKMPYEDFAQLSLKAHGFAPDRNFYKHFTVIDPVFRLY